MSRLLPYETILKAREGDPEAVNAVLLHYAGYIRYFSKVNGQVNAEVEDYVKQRLIDCQFKFRLDEPPDKVSNPHFKWGFIWNPSGVLY